MSNWFTVDRIDADTFSIGKYKYTGIQPDFRTRMCDAFRRLRVEGGLHFGSGTFDCEDWRVRL